MTGGKEDKNGMRHLVGTNIKIKKHILCRIFDCPPVGCRPIVDL